MLIGRVGTDHTQYITITYVSRNKRFELNLIYLIVLMHERTPNSTLAYYDNSFQ